MEPLVSIIVPVYNTEKYLKECLDSLVHQTYKNTEIICVNDGSTDNSEEILNKYAEKHPNINVLNKKNGGVSSARNAGLKVVSGKYLMFVDSDDWIDSDTCELAVSAAKKNRADLVFWSYTREFKNISKPKHFFWKDGEVFEEKDVRSKLHRRLCGLTENELKHPDYISAFETVCTKLYFAEPILKNQLKFVDLKEIGSSEDGLFNLYAVGYMKKAIYLKKCLYHYRKTNEYSLTSSYKCQLFVQFQNLFRKIRDYIDDNLLPNSYEKALDNRIVLSILGLGLNIMASNCSAKKKIQKIKVILNSETYCSACKNLELKYFSIHWKLFYGCAKHKFAFGIYILLLAIQMLK